MKVSVENAVGMQPQKVGMTAQIDVRWVPLTARPARYGQSAVANEK